MNQNSTIIRLLDAIDRNDMVNIYAIGAEVRTAMGSKNSGLNGLLPAFPCPSPLHGHPHPGITKEEYFAAHAPMDIPDWFKPYVEHLGARPEYVRVINEEDGEVYNKNGEAAAEWDMARDQVLYFQWRRFYGQQMAAL